MTHGFATTVILPDEEAELVAERRVEWSTNFRPVTVEERFHFEQLVLNTIRIERCQAREIVIRTEISRRALANWDEDRKLVVENLAAGISKRPSLVSQKLQSTAHGCDWLLARWRGLKETLEQSKQWSEDESSLAADLAGVPLEFRKLDPWKYRGHASARAMVESEITRLERLQVDVLIPLDESERAAAQMGLELETPRELVLLRRYEAACHRKFDRSVRVLETCRVKTVTPAPSKPAVKPAPLPAAPLPPISGTPLPRASYVDVCVGPIPTKVPVVTASPAQNEPNGALGKMRS